MQVVMNKCFFS